MILSLLSKKKILIPLGIFIFIASFLSHIPLNSYVNSEIKKVIPRKCANDVPEFKISLFPLPSLRAANQFTLSSKCSGFSNNMVLKHVELSNRGFSFSPVGLKFNTEIIFDKFNPLEVSLSIGAGTYKLIMDRTIIDSSLISEFVRLPLDIEGELQVNLIASLAKNAITELEAEIGSTNLNLPSQMISGFNIPNIIASPLKIIAKISNPKDLEINAIQIGDKKSDLYLIGKGDIKNFSDSRSASLNIMSTLALKKELKTQFSFINLLLGNPNDLGEYKFQVSGKLSSPRVKSLN